MIMKSFTGTVGHCFSFYIVTFGTNAFNVKNLCNYIYNLRILPNSETFNNLFSRQIMHHQNLGFPRN